VHKKVLDVMNTLGVSNSLIRMIEKRQVFFFSSSVSSSPNSLIHMSDKRQASNVVKTH
jgi:hypothetical protein